MPTSRPSLRHARLAWSALALLCVGCSPWRLVERRPGYSLYAYEEQEVDPLPWSETVRRAHAAVERWLGPFDDSVRVHLSSPVGHDADSKELPGIGRASVPGWHLRGNYGGNPDGVFLAQNDLGTAVHELVHARLEQTGETIPIWLDEGIASFIGDGAWYRDEWAVDGLAWWPLLELREQRLEREEFERVLGLDTDHEPYSRENALAHFVGWAIVFDVARETGEADWRRWFDVLEREHDADALWARLQRVLAPETDLEWLARLDSPDPSVRFATAVGSWKAGSFAVLDRLLAAIPGEADDEVRAALVVNAIACAGELPTGFGARPRVAQVLISAVAETRLANEAEGIALQALAVNGMLSAGRRDRTAEAIHVLRRFWDE